MSLEIPGWVIMCLNPNPGVTKASTRLCPNEKNELVTRNVNVIRYFKLIFFFSETYKSAVQK